MQTLESQYGQDSLTVDDEIPTVILRYRLGNVHIGEADAEVIRIVEEGITAGGTPDYSDSQRSQTIAAALWLHRENRAEYMFVMGGMR